MRTNQYRFAGPVPTARRQLRATRRPGKAAFAWPTSALKREAQFKLDLRRLSDTKATSTRRASPGSMTDAQSAHTSDTASGLLDNLRSQLENFQQPSQKGPELTKPGPKPSLNWQPWNLDQPLSESPAPGWPQLPDPESLPDINPQTLSAAPDFTRSGDGLDKITGRKPLPTINPAGEAETPLINPANVLTPAQRTPSFLNQVAALIGKIALPLVALAFYFSLLPLLRDIVSQENSGARSLWGITGNWLHVGNPGSAEMVGMAYWWLLLPLLALGFRYFCSKK